jgi:RNA polymerase sigma-70 factor (sigma-E family)
MWAPPTLVAVPAVGSDRQTGIRALYTERHAEMVRFATFLTGDAHAAEDLTQEAFVKVYDAWERIDDPERAVAYLRATIVNLTRGRHRRQVVADRNQQPHLSIVASAEDDAMGRVDRDTVLAAVAALPHRQRACVVMKHWLRMTEGEIATTLELSIGSVRTHTKRGVDALQRTLGEQR